MPYFKKPPGFNHTASVNPNGEVNKAFSKLIVDRSDYVLNIDGVVEAQEGSSTMAGTDRQRGRISLGHGCFKISRNIGPVDLDLD